MENRFVALDVETANPDVSSICKIGLVYFEDGKIVGRKSIFIDPEDYFDPINSSIHGITEDMVVGAPKFPKLANIVLRELKGSIIVHHTYFDRASLLAAAEKYSLELPEWRWLDSARVVRRVWEDVRQTGYNLPNMASRLGIHFNHHDPEEDARAAGEVLIKASEASGISIEEWTSKAYERITHNSSHAMDGNPDGALYGHVIVFTGALSMVRSQAAKMASEAGCQVADGVTKDTTLLVVGDQDVKKLAGHEKSSKHRKAEELIVKGQGLRILRETDFLKIIQA